MSNVASVTTPAEWEELDFEVPTIASDNWNRGYENDDKSLEKTLTAFMPFVSMILFLSLFSKFGPLGNYPSWFSNEYLGAAAFMGILIAMISGSFFAATKLSKRIVSSQKKKRKDYREQYAKTIIEKLAEKGWTIDSRDAVVTLVHDNNPYVVNANGIRYYARQFRIEKGQVSCIFYLSDEEAEKTVQDRETAGRIAFLVSQYEKTNGPMSPEKKSGFEAALLMSL